MIEQADPKTTQNDWRGDPDNPQVQHDAVMRSVTALRREEMPSIPSDIEQMIHDLAHDPTHKLMVWYRSLGIPAIQIEMFLCSLAARAVRHSVDTSSR